MNDSPNALKSSIYLLFCVRHILKEGIKTGKAKTLNRSVTYGDVEIIIDQSKIYDKAFNTCLNDRYLIKRLKEQSVTLEKVSLFISKLYAALQNAVGESTVMSYFFPDSSEPRQKLNLKSGMLTDPI